MQYTPALPIPLSSSSMEELTYSITFNNHHDYLKKLNEFRKDIYPEVQEHLSATTERRSAKD